MKNASRRRAFTLVELLIVCAIIALLSALLLGVFQRVREYGRSSTCQSNLHQLSLALQQYVQDNDSRFPGALFLEAPLTSYIKDAQIFKCPSSFANSSSFPFPDYIFPPWLAQFERTAEGMKASGGRNEAFVVDAANFITMWDDLLQNDGTKVTITTNCLHDPTQRTQEVNTRHFGGFNIAYADGHVKWRGAQQLADETCKISEAYPELHWLFET